MISLTIDGKPIQAEPGATVLEAALANGIYIPRLCYHPDLRPSGGCRLCLVEVEGRRDPQTSCGLACEAGMIVRTQSDMLFKMRHDIIDLFVSDHPLHCVVCDKNGACDLQRYAYHYQVAETSFGNEFARTLCQDDNPFFIRDHQYCIMCAKCVRVCDEIVGANAIDIVGRGFPSYIATPFDRPLKDSTCVFCGSCVQVCPTAALLPKSRLGQGREWELSRIRSICSYCGVGCGIEYALKDGQIVYAQGFAGALANGEFLCVKGRFGWDFAASPDRLTQPLVRRSLLDDQQLSTVAQQNGLQPQGPEEFVPVSWDLALDIAAVGLAQAVQTYGPDAVAGLASARCTNEENYLFQKLFRATIGSNNVDHCARLCHASSVTGLGMAFGSAAMTNPIQDIRNADCILITGSNTAESHPVISYEVVRAVHQGANLIIIDPRRVPLVDHATLFIQPKSGTDIFIFLAMAHVILREGWADTEFIKARTEGFEEFVKSVEGQTPEVAALASGVPAAQIEQAARMYALGERATTAATLSPINGASPPARAGRGNAAILYAMGITQRSNGTELVLSLANLAMLSGQIGKPSSGINPLRGQSNVQGACDVGALPNVLPGYQPVTNDVARAAVAQAWGMSSLPATPGLTVVEMMHVAIAGKLRAMYVMGENPMLSDPNLNHVEEGLRALDFLVVQDIFMSETARLAHVVLPAAAALEKDGSKTNTERRVQLIVPVLPAPGVALPDWQIVCALGRRLDKLLERGRDEAVWNYSSTAAIMDEVAQVTPIYGGMRHQRLAGNGLVWPCPNEQHPGTPVLHTQTFTRGRGKFHAVESRLPAELPDAEFPLVLNTGRVLYHYHTGTMTRRSEGLAWREPHGYAEISALDAAAAGIHDGEMVVLRSRRGMVQAEARVSSKVTPGMVFFSFHWSEAPANLLTQDFALDPFAKIPEYKVCAVRLEAVDGVNAERRAMNAER